MTSLGVINIHVIIKPVIQTALYLAAAMGDRTLETDTTNTWYSLLCPDLLSHLT